MTTEGILGPSLKGVMGRREAPWVRQMIRDGQKLVAQKDTYALAQYEEYNNIVHPDCAYLPEKDLDDLPAYRRPAGEKQ